MGYSATQQPVKTNGQIDLYVAADAAGANDGNQGTTPSTPLKTINEAIRRCNVYDEISASFIIHVAPAPVAGYTLTTTLGAHLLRASIVIIGDGAGQGGDGFTVLSGPSAAVAGSSATQVVRAAGLGVNTFRGKTIEILTGAAAGDRRTIRDHTDTTITPVRNFTAAVAANDTFRIIEPAATVTFGGGTNTPYTFSNLNGSNAPTTPFMAGAATVTQTPVPMVAVVNLILLPATTATPLAAYGTRLAMYGCQISTNQWLIRTDSTWSVGCDSYSNPQQAFLGQNVFAAPAPTSWSGWGTYALAGMQVIATGMFYGFCVAVATAAGALAFLNGTVHIFGGSLETSLASTGAVLYSQGVGSGIGTFMVNQESSIGNTIQTLITNTNGGLSLGIDTNAALTDSGTVLIKLHRCTITANGATGQAIRAMGNTTLTIGSSVTGTGGAMGLNCSRGAKAYIAGAIALTQNGGGGNDLTTNNGGGFTAVGAVGVGAEVATGVASCIIRIS
jgi:hypothetical protein